MKVLWLCNNPTPEIATLVCSNAIKPESWITAYLEYLKKEKIELVYLFKSKISVNKTIDNITYISYFEKNPEKYSRKLNYYFAELLKKEKPDVVHIWGTEYPHSYSMTEAAKRVGILDSTIISIQGLASEIAKVYYNELKFPYTCAFTPRDFAKFDNLLLQKKKFKNRGKYEIKAIKNSNHIIGRTDWDRAKTVKHNAKVTYHFCNEILRPAFYSSKKWSFDNCEKNSIFVSQSNYPLKGFHIMLLAFSKLTKRYPDAKLYTTGLDPFLKDKKYLFLHQTEYNRFLKKLINKLSLRDKVVFLGDLSEEKMIERYLLSNVFVSCSSLENSSNSICEAQYLGVPIVASFVGGIPNLLDHKKNSFLFEKNDIEMLVEYVTKVFDNKSICDSFSLSGIDAATRRHSVPENVKLLLDIYENTRQK